MMKWNSKAALYFGKALRAYKYRETQSIADALIRFGNCLMNTGDLLSALLGLISHMYQKAKKGR